MANLVKLELSMTSSVQFPALRNDVIVMLGSLSDRAHQERAWIQKQFEAKGSYEDLGLVVNILFDDACVLPDPESRLHSVLFEAEVEPLSKKL